MFCCSSKVIPGITLHSSHSWTPEGAILFPIELMSNSLALRPTLQPLLQLRTLLAESPTHLEYIPIGNCHYPIIPSLEVLPLV